MNKYQPLKKLELCKKKYSKCDFLQRKIYIEFGGKVQKGNKMAFYTTKWDPFLDG